MSGMDIDPGIEKPIQTRVLLKPKLMTMPEKEFVEIGACDMFAYKNGSQFRGSKKAY